MQDSRSRHTAVTEAKARILTTIQPDTQKGHAFTSWLDFCIHSQSARQILTSSLPVNGRVAPRACSARWNAAILPRHRLVPTTYTGLPVLHASLSMLTESAVTINVSAHARWPRCGLSPGKKTGGLMPRSGLSNPRGRSCQVGRSVLRNSVYQETS